MPLLLKCMKEILERFRDILRQKGCHKAADEATDTAIRRHFYRIMEQKNWKLVLPKLVDVKRCAIYGSMLMWYTDPEIAYLLSTVDSDLYYNGDETEINTKNVRMNKVIQLPGEAAEFPRPEGPAKHVSLFLIISASREVILPFPFIHGDSLNYADTCMDDERVRLYKTDKGYMDQETLRKELTAPAEELKELAEELTEPAEELTAPGEELTEPAEELAEPAEELSAPEHFE